MSNRLYTEAIRLKSNYARQIFVNRGQAKSRLEDIRGAIADYSEAIRLNPNNTQAYTFRGDEKKKLGDKKGALNDYTEAIRLDPNYAQSYLGMGSLKRDLGNCQEGRIDIEKASELYKQQENRKWYELCIEILALHNKV